MFNDSILDQMKKEQVEAQAKANNIQTNIKTTPAPKIKQAITAVITPAPTLLKMLSFTIIWHEGTGNFDGKIFTTWLNANDAIMKIYKQHSGAGYTKVKVQITWEDDKFLVDRIDCGNNGEDYNGDISIGEYIKSQDCAMYESNLNTGDRQTILSWNDSDNISIAPVINVQPAPAKRPLKQAAIDDKIKIQTYKKAIAVTGNTKPIKDLLGRYGLRGIFNPRLEIGAGWIFPKYLEDTVRKTLSAYL